MVKIVNNQPEMRYNTQNQKNPDSANRVSRLSTGAPDRT